MTWSLTGTSNTAPDPERPSQQPRSGPLGCILSREPLVFPADLTPCVFTHTGVFVYLSILTFEQLKSSAAPVYYWVLPAKSPTGVECETDHL